MSFQDHYEASLRLALLRALLEAPGESANASVLHRVVQEDFRFNVERSKIHNELGWLQEQSFVTVEELSATVRVGTLTERGARVARGIIKVEGVDTPLKKG